MLLDLKRLNRQPLRISGNINFITATIAFPLDFKAVIIIVIRYLHMAVAVAAGRRVVGRGGGTAGEP